MPELFPPDFMRFFECLERDSVVSSGCDNQLGLAATLVLARFTLERGLNPRRSEQCFVHLGSQTG